MTDSYDRAVHRILLISIAVGLIGALIAGMHWGLKIGVGFLIGALLSLVNLHWLSALVNAIGDSGKAPLRGSAIILLLRFLILGALIYGIVKILKITPAALLAGLLVSVAAVTLEALYELIYART
jgi:hypothetical protein